jgi:hypothetical protein
MYKIVLGPILGPYYSSFGRAEHRRHISTLLVVLTIIFRDSFVYAPRKVITITQATFIFVS